MTRVLLVRLSAMGDLVQALGAAASLRRARPDWHVTMLTQATFAPLLDGVEGIDAVETFARRGGVAEVVRVRRRLREHAFAHALDLQGNWKSALFTRLARAGDRIGIAAGARQEPWSRLLLGRTVACPAAPHPARVAWELVRALAPEAPFVRPRLAATADEVAVEAAALRAIGVDPSEPVHLVVAGDPADPRALRPAALRSLVAPQTVFVFGPMEAHVAAPAGAAVLRHRPGELRRLVALGALVAATGGDLVGCDQGPSHVLAAAGVRARVLFGSQDPRRTAPAAAQATALVHAAPPPCSPCRQRRCTLREGPVCMDFAPGDGRIADVGLPPP